MFCFSSRAINCARIAFPPFALRATADKKRDPNNAIALLGAGFSSRQAEFIPPGKLKNRRRSYILRMPGYMLENPCMEHYLTS